MPGPIKTPPSAAIQKTAVLGPDELAKIAPPAAIQRTLLLETEPAVPPPSDDHDSSPRLPTRLLPPTERAPERLRPATVVSPDWLARDPAPAPGKSAPALRRLTPTSESGKETLRVPRSFRAWILVGVTLACIALGTGLLLLLHLQASQPPVAPIEELAPRQEPMAPPLPPSPAPKSFDTPTPVADQPPALLQPVQPAATGRPQSNSEKSRGSSRRPRTRSPATANVPPTEEDILVPNFDGQ